MEPIMLNQSFKLLNSRSQISATQPPYISPKAQVFLIAHFVAVVLVFAVLGYGTANADHLRRGIRTTGVDLIDNATLAYHAGDLEGAIAGYTVAINSTRLSRLNRAIAYFDRGVAFSDLGDHFQAIDDYDQAISLVPDEPAFYNNRGNSFHQIDDDEAAVLDYNSALSLDRRDPFVYYNRGTALTDLGATSQAAQDFDFALSLNPDLAIVYRGRGRLSRILGQFEQALSDFDTVQQLDPALDVTLNKAYVLFFLGLLTEAEGELGDKCLQGCTLYEALGRYIIRDRIFNDARVQLADDVAGTDLGVWPGPVALFFLGQLSEANLLNAAFNRNDIVRRQQMTMATFMVGQYHLLNGDDDRAADLFEQTLDQDLETWLQNTGAREELIMLGRL